MSESILSQRSLDKAISKIDWNEKKLSNDQQTLKRWSESLNSVWGERSETELTASFYSQILHGILGYIEGPKKYFTMAFEHATKSSAQKPDVILGRFDQDVQVNQPIALIEFESPSTSLDEKGKGVSQAFRYQSQYDSPVRWIIASNFFETRIYDATREHVEVFSIDKIATNKAELKKFILFLGAKYLILPSKSSRISLPNLVETNMVEQEKITKEFYATYLDTRVRLENNISQNNMDVDDAHAFTYAQKILDRFIFIAFAEDYELIPQGTFQRTQITNERTFSRYQIWEHMKTLFDAIDRGWPEKNINRFNGGLFKKDNGLDSLNISDGVFEDFEKIANYDFRSDLSVNLLGHIFEQAINDIDAAKHGIDNSSKRKKDGIFYTPASITSYLLQETIQSWIKDTQKDLGLEKLAPVSDEDIQMYRAFVQKRKLAGSTKIQRSNASTRKVENRVALLQKYRDRLRKIKLVDPAVGSGSFLNKAFDILKDEQKQIDGQLESLTGTTDFWDFDSKILSDNLYGVDINRESVEIAKLSLWLKTANKNAPLTTLDSNLKAGNSVINDPEVSPMAFNWKEEFEDVFSNNFGFDIVIGNPPYVFAQGNFTDNEKKYYSTHYDMSQYQENLYRIFTEKGWHLLKYDGWFGFIVPNTWFTNKSFSKMRSFLREKTTNLKIVSIKDRVFPDASVDTSLIIFKKHLNVDNKEVTLSEWKNESITFSQVQTMPENTTKPVVVQQKDETSKRIMAKINSAKWTLKDLMKVTAGIELFEKGKGNPAQPMDPEKFDEFKLNNKFFSNIKLTEDYYPYIDGSDVVRYGCKSPKKYLRYGNHLASKRKLNNFTGTHIVVRRIPSQSNHVNIGTILEDTFLNEQAIWDLQPIDKSCNQLYILGIINSSVITYWMIYTLDLLARSTFPQLRSYHIQSYPIPQASIRTQNRLVALVTERRKIVQELIQTKQSFEDTLKASWIGFSGHIDISNQNEFKKLLQKFSPISDRASLFEYFNTTSARLRALRDKEHINEKSIDHQVAVAFGLTAEDEVRIRTLLTGVVGHMKK